MVRLTSFCGNGVWFDCWCGCTRQGYSYSTVRDLSVIRSLSLFLSFFLSFSLSFFPSLSLSPSPSLSNTHSLSLSLSFSPSLSIYISLSLSFSFSSLYRRFMSWWLPWRRGGYKHVSCASTGQVISLSSLHGVVSYYSMASSRVKSSDNSKGSRRLACGGRLHFLC